MDLGIKGRKAIVAGGSAGMGRATAAALAKEGAEVLISARNEERLREAAGALSRDIGREVRFVRADHSTPEGRAAVLAACPAPDILVTTVSPPPYTPDFRQITSDDWMNAYRTGTVGPIELMRGVLDGMSERKWGRIINIVTVAIKFPVERRLLSGAPRTTLASYTAVVARKVAKHNVTINNLLPGMYATESFLSRDNLAQAPADVVDQAKSEVARQWRIPAGRMGEPEDFGRFAAMFASECANFIVGQNVVIDGGSGGGMF
ncbi:SDR family oxidoreductase [Bradyrhizobium vignae]|uniref:SDR family oxidoreductase n=1 Tax=Bradyrhizobium vignae TaxID=1549949 RepID=UPI00100AE86D|nr:SDR family oxidoreductase [Bradyrhizobium vignae]RXH06656.1 SDR family oxidoreductase [Bradyrhizobium vignae]